MGKISLKKDISLSVIVKVAVLLLNFAIVWLTARLWGAEGKGGVAIFIANLGIIAIVCNIFTSSSVSYFFSRVSLSKLLTQAYMWVLIVAVLSTLLLGLYNVHVSLLLPLFVIAMLLGVIAFHSSVFIGNQQIFNYNLIAFLQPLLLLITIMIIYFLNKDLGYYTYFYSQIISLSLLLIISVILRRRSISNQISFDFDKKVVKKSFNFGWQVELSSLLQFLNYRFSMYALEKLTDLGEVGVFSIGIQVMEAIWIFSRSISLVQYSNVLKLGDTMQARKETEKISLISLYISLACIIVAVVLPASVYTYVFGSEFYDVKKVICLLAPGTLFIAVSNVYGNYFSAIGKLKVLIIKSAIGLVFTIILALLLIPKLQIVGASIVNTISYIVSSIVLFVYYFAIHKKKKSVDIL